MDYTRCDGVIIIGGDEKAYVLVCRQSATKVTLAAVESLRRLVDESNFEANTASFDIVYDYECVTVHAILPVTERTQAFTKKVTKEFRRLIRSSGVLRRPMICELNVPVSLERLHYLVS